MYVEGPSCCEMFVLLQWCISGSCTADASAPTLTGQSVGKSHKLQTETTNSRQLLQQNKCFSSRQLCCATCLISNLAASSLVCCSLASRPRPLTRQSASSETWTRAFVTAPTSSRPSTPASATTATPWRTAARRAPPSTPAIQVRSEPPALLYQGAVFRPFFRAVAFFSVSYFLRGFAVCCEITSVVNSALKCIDALHSVCCSDPSGTLLQSSIFCLLSNPSISPTAFSLSL